MSTNSGFSPELARERIAGLSAVDLALRSANDHSVAVVSGLLVNILALSGPIFMMTVYDRVIPHRATSSLLVLVVGVTLAILFEGMLRVLRGRYLERAGKDRAEGLTHDVLACRLDLGQELARNPRMWSGSLGDLDKIRDGLSAGVVVAISDLPFALIYAVVVAAIGGWTVVAPVLVGLAVIALSVFGDRAQIRPRVALAEASAKRNALAMETATNIETVRRFNAQGLALARLDILGRAASSASTAMRLTMAMVAAGQAASQNLVLVAVSVVGAPAVMAGDLSFGGLIASTMLSGRMVGAAGAFAASWPKISSARSALEGLRSLAHMPSDHPPESRSKPKHLSGQVEMSNVSFAYPGSAPILRSISFALPAGEGLAILGVSGAGKTTLERLLTRQVAAGAGSILLDRHSISLMDPDHLRNHIAVLPQRPELFEGTLRDAIAFGRPIDDAAIERVLSGFGPIGLSLLSSGKGLDLAIGPTGSGLSGGQAQIVALARCLLSGPETRLFILDEPTTGLDPLTETQALKVMEAATIKATRIVITHKQHVAVRLAGRVLVLKDGALVAPAEQTASR